VIAEYAATHPTEKYTPLPVAIGAKAQLIFGKYGLDNVSLQVDEFCHVLRTLRNITGFGDRWTAGDTLSTDEWNEE
jgi:hypothetical protein